MWIQVKAKPGKEATSPPCLYTHAKQGMRIDGMCMRLQEPNSLHYMHSITVFS
jgi:hypothetical protein